MSEGTHLASANGTATRGDLEFRSLLEKLPAAAYTCDSGGLITFFNQRAVDLWGREPALNDPVDRFCGSFKLFSADGTPVAHQQCWMALALRDNREYNGHEILIERPDGTRCTALAHANPTRDGEGNLVGAVNVLVDISDRKQAEERVREADRRKTEFLALLAHELRSPLAPISTSLEILKVAKDDPVVSERAREMMARQLHQMTRLIDDLLDMSRITSNKLKMRLERVDLSIVVHQAIESCRPAARAAMLDLTVTLPKEAVILLADPVRLTQIVSNLLNNACKFTPAGGRIDVEVTRQGSSVEIVVRDSGIGISPDMLPRIFDMFTQVERPGQQPQGGLGIGLTLVRALAEFHGGGIKVRSEGAGRGSEFIVRLPIPPDLRSHPAPQPANETAAPRPGRRILVVDDHPDAALSLAMLLRLAGHETSVVNDGLSALSEAERFRPEVVLLDIGMPGLDGYETCRRLRELAHGPHMHLIALTGWGQEQDRRRTEQAGFDRHLVKPVDPPALMRLIADLPARGRAEVS